MQYTLDASSLQQLPGLCLSVCGAGGSVLEELKK